MSTTTRAALSRFTITISTQILAAVGVAILSLAIVGGLSFAQLGSLASAGEKASADAAVMSTKIITMQNALWAVRQQIVVVAAYPHELRAEERTTLEASYTTFVTAMDDFIATYSSTFGTEPEGSGELRVAWEDYRLNLDNDVLPAAMGDDRDQFAPVRTGAPAKGAALVHAVTAMTEQVEAKLEAQAKDNERTASQVKLLVVGLAVAALAVAGGLGWFIASRIRGSLHKVQRSLEALAEGDLTVPADVVSRDEVGDMARALAKAQESLRATMSAVAGSSQTVASAAEELSAANAQVASGAHETSAQAGVVASAATEVSRSVQEVAAGAEQMGASIKEIAHNANEAARVAAQATAVAVSTNEQVAKLGASSEEIAEIATIVQQINDYQMTISSAVEEQEATTNEMSRGVNEAAQGSSQIAANIVSVADATGDSSRVLEQIGSSVGELAELAADLRSQVATFRY